MSLSPTLQWLVKKVSLPLIRGTTTLDSALEQEEEMLLDLDYPESRIDFFVSLYYTRGEIEEIASYHLGLDSSDTCRLAEVNEWVQGGFNVCIPLYVNKQNQRPEKRALIRFSLPYKVGSPSTPTTWMKNSVVKLRISFGYESIVRRSRFLSCGDLDLLVVRVYESSKNITCVCYVQTNTKIMQFTKPENTPLVFQAKYIMALGIGPGLPLFLPSSSNLTGKWILGHAVRWKRRGANAIRNVG